MKTLIAVFVCAVLACGVLAADPKPAAKSAPARASENQWDFIGVAFFPKAPPNADVTDVYGLKLGIPVSFGEKSKVVGAELGLFASTTVAVKGFQGALLYCDAEKVSGLQANPIVNVAKDVSGVQAGLINVAKGDAFQIGLINYIKDSPLPVFPLINVRF